MIAISDVLQAYGVSSLDRVYLLSPVSRHVCFASAQARAIALARALIVENPNRLVGSEVAIIGAGVSGATLALCLTPWAGHVTLFDRESAPVHVQQCASFRHVFRYMYAWPDIADVSAAIDRAVGDATLDWLAPVDGVASELSASLRARIEALVAAGRVTFRGSSSAAIVRQDGNKVTLSAGRFVGDYDLAVVASGFAQDSVVPGTTACGYWDRPVAQAIPQDAGRVAILGAGDGATYDAVELALGSPDDPTPYRTVVTTILKSEQARRVSRRLDSTTAASPATGAELAALADDLKLPAARQRAVEVFARRTIREAGANPVNRLILEVMRRQELLTVHEHAEVTLVRPKGSKSLVEWKRNEPSPPPYDAVVSRVGSNRFRHGASENVLRSLPLDPHQRADLQQVLEANGALDARPHVPPGSAFVLHSAETTSGPAMLSAVRAATLSPVFIACTAPFDEVYLSDFVLTYSDLLVLRENLGDHTAWIDDVASRQEGHLDGAVTHVTHAEAVLLATLAGSLVDPRPALPGRLPTIPELMVFDTMNQEDPVDWRTDPTLWRRGHAEPFRGVGGLLLLRGPVRCWTRCGSVGPVVDLRSQGVIGEGHFLRANSAMRASDVGVRVVIRRQRAS